MMGFCMSILYKNEQDFLLYFLLYIYIYFFVVNESPLPTILHDILFPHLLNPLYKISQKTMI